MTDLAGARRRLYLRASIKLLVTIGLGLLLVPFIASLPWPSEKIPEDATVLAGSAIAAGQTRKLTLADGSAVFVTRSSATVAEGLRAIPEDRLWFPSAPDLAGQRWFVLRATSALDEPVDFRPAQGTWPGGFTTASGAAWDLAGRALKPWPGHPSGYAMKVQNLLPMPFKLHDDDLVLVPLPVPASLPPAE